MVYQVGSRYRVKWGERPGEFSTDTEIKIQFTLFSIKVGLILFYAFKRHHYLACCFLEP